MKNHSLTYLHLHALKQWVVSHHIAILLCVIIAVGAFMRFYDFTDLLRFNNDQVRDAKIIDAMILNNDFPLLGPKAGGTTFKLGPAFYYMEYLSAQTFGNTPQGIALFVPILGTLSILLFYVLFKKYFTHSIALLLTGLYATSFYVIKYARFAWNPNTVPFFLFLFFILLLKTLSPQKKHVLWWFCALGITTGIAMQLHTTLLIILPIIIALTHSISYFRTKRISIAGIALTYGLIIICISPMLSYDLDNRGANIAAFLQGSETKSAQTRSLTQNILLDGQFFTQSTIYVITGTELTKNWIDPKKLLLSHNYKEIAIAITSGILFLIGVFFFIKNSQNPNTTTDEKKDLHTLLLSATILCFILFIPIAHEINTRFFIILIFLPFIFLGLFFDTLLQTKKISRHIAIITISLLTSILIGCNMYTYSLAYDLTRDTTNSDLYGGISLLELTELTRYMDSHKDQKSANELHLLPHTYGQSLRYIAHQNTIPLVSTAPNNVPNGARAFYLSDKSSDLTLPKKLSCFTIIDTQHILRFRIFTLQKTNDICT